MPNTEVKKYEPMILIELKNGRKLFTLAAARETIQERWNSKEINFIEDVTVAYWMIATIEDMPADYDLLMTLPEDLRNRVIERLRQYEQNLGYKPPRTVKIRIIEKLTKEYERHNKNEA